MLIFDKGGVKGKFLFPPNKAWKMYGDIHQMANSADSD